jgi:hypothetical protein
MEQEKKTLVLSVLVTMFFTAFVVSSIMLYLFYQGKIAIIENKVEQSVNQSTSEVGQLPQDSSNFQVGY